MTVTSSKPEPDKATPARSLGHPLPVLVMTIMLACGVAAIAHVKAGLPAKDAALLGLGILMAAVVVYTLTRRSRQIAALHLEIDSLKSDLAGLRPGQYRQIRDLPASGVPRGKTVPRGHDHGASPEMIPPGTRNPVMSGPRKTVSAPGQPMPQGPGHANPTVATGMSAPFRTASPTNGIDPALQHPPIGPHGTAAPDIGPGEAGGKPARPTAPAQKQLLDWSLRPGRNRAEPLRGAEPAATMTAKSSGSAPPSPQAGASAPSWTTALARPQPGSSEPTWAAGQKVAPVPGATSTHPSTNSAPPEVFGADRRWPQATPSPSTMPLDLSNMQTLIDQLAVKLEQPINAMAQPADDVAQAQARPAQLRQAPQSLVPGRTAGYGGSSPATPILVEPAAKPRDASAVQRYATSAPVGHLALVAEAVEARRMDVYLDPILGLSDRKTRHFEMSVRLRSDDGSEFDAAALAEIAAGTGLLARIDAEKLTRAAAIAHRLRTRDTRASLFSSLAGESLADDNFVSSFAETFAAEEGLATKLILTFAQSDARAFTTAHWHVIATMADIGLKFAIDNVTDLDMDFGQLKISGFDFVKLDAQVFLEGLPAPGGRIPSDDICRHLSSLGLALIVGGIVAERDLAKICGFGAILGQGALFGGPRSVSLDRARRAA